MVNLRDYMVAVSGSHVSVAELERIARSIPGVADLSDPSTWPDAEEALQPR